MIKANEIYGVSLRKKETMIGWVMIKKFGQQVHIL